MEEAEGLFRRFKVSRVGVFVLQRWLPIQDVATDMLVVFCSPEQLGEVVCPDDGYIVKDPCWTVVGSALVAAPYVLLWITASKKAMEFLTRDMHMRERTARCTYVLLGLPGPKHRQASNFSPRSPLAAPQTPGPPSPVLGAGGRAPQMRGPKRLIQNV